RFNQRSESWKCSWRPSLSPIRIINRRRGWTALFYAVEKGDINIMRQLVKAGASGHVDAVQVLSEFGASVNEKNHQGKTALILAAHEGHLNAVRALVELGSKVDEKETSGRATLNIGAEWRSLSAGEVIAQLSTPTHHSNLNTGTSYQDAWQSPSKALSSPIGRRNTDTIS
uniref:Uncharacterized protein n=1 Tax=Globisporangium ultimum (strain ATCC 200006 / CBS 805.95 / DAOM BR144) TaxID=431595 RepID=K3WV61_GLOUD